MDKRAASIVFLLFVLGAALAGAAEEDAKSSAHVPYFYVIHTTVEPSLVADWTEAVAKTAQAHARHPAVDEGVVVVADQQHDTIESHRGF